MGDSQGQTDRDGGIHRIAAGLENIHAHARRIGLGGDDHRLSGMYGLPSSGGNEEGYNEQQRTESCAHDLG